jgi:hypothetical protein
VVEINIPQEMSQMPVGMLTDVMREKTSAGVDSSVMQADRMDFVPVEAPPPEPEIEVNEPAELISAGAPQLDIAEKTVWTAEPAEMTPEEAKLFEQPSANWGDLEHLVEQTGTQAAVSEPAPEPMFPPEPAAPPPPPWQFEVETSDQLVTTGPDPGLELADNTFAETATEPELESYENLADTVAAQGPIRTAAAAPDLLPPVSPEEEAPEGGAPPPYGGPVEELEADPSDRNLPQQPSVDDLVRKAVDELMPEIIGRVKKSLGNS